MILKKKYYKRERNTFSLILSLSASSAALTNERANVFLACVFQSTQKSNLGFFSERQKLSHIYEKRSFLLFRDWFSF